MQTQHNLSLAERKEKVWTWMRSQGLTYGRLGARLGVTANGVSRMFERQSIPSQRHRQLLEAGVPPELLPPPRDIPPGPRKRCGLDSLTSSQAEA